MEGSGPSDIPKSDSNSESEENKAYGKELFEDLYESLATAQRRLTTLESKTSEQTSRRLQAEDDLEAQIQKANMFENIYHTEWSRRKSVEAELEKAKKRIEDLEKLLEDRTESSKRD